MSNLTAQMRKVLKTSALAVSLAVTPLAFAGDNNAHYEKNSELKDAWIDGKVETALLVNRHLNNFTIDTEVENGAAILTGTVKSEVDKELATEIAKGIEGVTKVHNKLMVKPDTEFKQDMEDAERSFGQWYDDSTTTAAIKSKLLWNSETSGISVNVDTMKGEVILKGEVDSDAERDLIEQIAQNTDGVRNVDNRITVVKNS